MLRLRPLPLFLLRSSPRPLSSSEYTKLSLSVYINTRCIVNSLVIATAALSLVFPTNPIQVLGTSKVLCKSMLIIANNQSNNFKGKLQKTPELSLICKKRQKLLKLQFGPSNYPRFLQNSPFYISILSLLQISRLKKQNSGSPVVSETSF